MTSKIVVNNIESDAGISSVTLVSNIAGEDSTQNISGINSVTANAFYGSGANLTGLESSSITKDVTIAVGAAATNAKLVNLNTSGQIGALPTMNAVATFVNDTNYALEPGNSTGLNDVYTYPHPDLNYKQTDTSNNAHASTGGVRYSKTGSGYRVLYSSAEVNNTATMTLTGQIMNADATYTSSGTTQTIATPTDNNNDTTECTIQQWKENYWVGVVRFVRKTTDGTTNNSGRYDRMSIQMFTVNPSTGAISLLGSKVDKAHNHQRGTLYEAASLGHFTEVQMRWNAVSLRMGKQSTRGIEQAFFKLTTSGISETGQVTHTQNNNNTGNRELGGLEHVYAAERCRSISGGTDRSIGLNDSAFEIYDFTGSYNENLRQSTTNYSSGTEAYDSEGFNIFINDTHFLHAYKDISAQRRIKIFSTDGAGGFSLVSNFIYEDTNVSNKFGFISSAAVKSATEIAVVFDNQTFGMKSLSSIELNGSYVIQGIKEPLRIDGIRGVIAHQSGNVYHVFNTNNSGGATTASYTVNNYKNSVPLNFIGFAQETKNSGTASVCFGGVATGFSGLTVGSNYYVDQLLTGEITTDTRSGNIMGMAISPTELLVGNVRS